MRAASECSRPSGIARRSLASPALRRAVGLRAAARDRHRSRISALYSLTLDSAKSASGVVGATGAMFYEWGEACDGWTVEQRFRLRLAYAEEDSVDISSTLVTWESKDGLSYRFNERRMRNGELDEEHPRRGPLDGPGKGGTAEFTKPETGDHRPGAGRAVPHRAHAVADRRSARPATSNSSRATCSTAPRSKTPAQVTAVIGPELKPSGGKAPKPLNDPLLQRPSWHIRLAFFPSDGKSDQTEPDYELGMRLLDNGVTQDMKLDYGDYVIHATLDEIEALPKPGC